jgi:hypothetical protein
MKRTLTILTLVFLAGCGTLVPKKVELFQDKVKTFPEPSPALREVQRQALHRAMESSEKVVRAAVAEGASTNVTVPAIETEQLTEAVSFSLGPPESPSALPAEKLVAKLESAVAKLNTKVEEFKSKNDENAGKKIEGTGLVQVSYFAWVGGILLAAMILFFLAKIFLTVLSAANPVASLGLLGVNATQATITKGLSQVIRGGETFKNWVGQEIEDSKLKQKILDAFQHAHLKSQDQDVQNTVMALTK